MYAISNLSVDSNVDIVETRMLYNSNNLNDYVYIDNLTVNPSLSDRDGEHYITEVHNTNYINGIPNLYPVSNSTSYEYRLNYISEGYSQFFGLTTNESFVSHTMRKKSSPFTTLSANL